MDDKAYRMLGMAKRAGKTVTGTDGVLNSVKSGKSFLVIMASDASDNTKKQIPDKCRSYNVRLITNADRDTISKMTSTENSAAVSIIDRGLADAIFNAFEK